MGQPQKVSVLIVGWNDSVLKDWGKYIGTYGGSKNRQGQKKKMGWIVFASCWRKLFFETRVEALCGLLFFDMLQGR